LRKSSCRKATHQAETARKKVRWERAWHLDQNPGFALVGGGRRANAAREEITKAAEAREADLHAYLGDGMLAHGQQEFGPFQTRLDTELVRRKSENGFKLADEIERRNSNFAGDVLNREPLLRHFHEQFSSSAEASKLIAG
jgi:hypothetical protein